MFRAFSNIPIFRRLAIAFAIATLIPILVILLLGNFSLQSGQTRSMAVQTSFDAQNIATREQINLQRMNSLLQARFAQIFAQGSLSLEGDPSSGKLTEDDINALEIGFKQSLTSYQKNYEIATSRNMNIIRTILTSDTPDQGKQMIRVQQQALDSVATTYWPNYQALLHKLLNDLAGNTFYHTAYADFYQADLGFLELKNRWQQVVDTATAMGTTVTQIGPSFTNPLLIFTCTALFLTLVVIIIAGFLINVTIIGPLRNLVVLTRRVANGDTDARATIRGRDEISQVASSMNGMLDNIFQLMQEAQNRHSVLQAHIQKMIDEVSGLGEGNLRVQVQSNSNELGMLAKSFNMMTEELNNLVVNVKILAHGVQKATLQAFGYMEQLVDNADLQIQEITQASAEVGHVAALNRNIAERAQALYDVTHEARMAANSGRNAVQQTVKSMGLINTNVATTSKKITSLGNRSREISNVLEVISGIAQQTNRLALDASVQAAMAGENGKGFGAVAVDIRRLAERSKEQSTLIAQIVYNVLDDINAANISMRETTRETAAGTHIAQEVGSSLEMMFSAVEHQASEIELNNQVATQQLQSTVRVVKIMQHVSDATRQNSLITRTVTQQMEGLAQIAGHLLASVDVFKLQEDRARISQKLIASENMFNARSGQQATQADYGSRAQTQFTNGSYDQSFFVGDPVQKEFPKHPSSIPDQFYTPMVSKKMLTSVEEQHEQYPSPLRRNARGKAQSVNWDQTEKHP